MGIVKLEHPSFPDATFKLKGPAVNLLAATAAFDVALRVTQALVTPYSRDMALGSIRRLGPQGGTLIARLASYRPAIVDAAYERLHDMVVDGLDLSALTDTPFPVSSYDTVVIPWALRPLVELDDGNRSSVLGRGELALHLLSRENLVVHPGGVHDIVRYVLGGVERWHVKDLREFTGGVMTGENANSFLLGNPSGEDDCLDWRETPVFGFLRGSGFNLNAFGVMDVKGNVPFEEALRRRYGSVDLQSAAALFEVELDAAMLSSAAWASATGMLNLMASGKNSIHFQRVDAVDTHFYSTTRGGTLRGGYEKGRFVRAIMDRTLQEEQAARDAAAKRRRADERRAIQEARVRARTDEEESIRQRRRDAKKAETLGWHAVHELAVMGVSSDKDLAVALGIGVGALRTWRGRFEQYGLSFTRPKRPAKAPAPSKKKRGRKAAHANRDSSGGDEALHPGTLGADTTGVEGER